MRNKSVLSRVNALLLTLIISLTAVWFAGCGSNIAKTSASEETSADLSVTASKEAASEEFAAASAADTSSKNDAEESDNASSDNSSASDNTEVPEDTAVDYSDASSWYQIPEITKDVDTIYFYPTLYSGFGEGKDDYAAIDNEEVSVSLEGVYLTQASVFEESTNVFVPYYRQASLRNEMNAYVETGGLEAALESKPLEDAKAALDYYFDNFNEGRPFILAGHSQGSALLRLALTTYFEEHTELLDRMVVAYIIGYSVTQQDLDEYTYLKFAEGETDTGVIVSWNTEGRENVDTDANNIVVVDGSIAINPLNWSRDDTYASSSENLGSLTMNFETGEAEFADIGADAQVNVERGVVVTNVNAEPLKGVDEYFGPQSFHRDDYAFYFLNIRDNVAKRIEAFQSGQ